MKVLANDGISASGKQELEEAGFTVVTDTVPQENLAGEINNKEYVALLVRSATKVRKDLIDQCPGLKLIGRGGVGMDNIDVEYAKSKGIEVINTPASSSQSVAELVFAHLFGVSRFLYDANREMPGQGATEFGKLKKKYAKGIELRGKTLGVIGFGRIGQSVAQYALGCGMKVVAYDPFVEQANIELDIFGAERIKVTINTISLDNVLSESDFLSLHVPMPEDGNALISRKEFDQMKSGVVIVNAARGGVVDEMALVEALDGGKVSHAALDVFVGEPVPSQEILSHSNISLSPHIGAATKEAQDRIGSELASKIITYFK